MDKDLKYWFEGFETGIGNMRQQERETLFCECGKRCAKRWVLNLYKDLYEKVSGDMDLFFEELNKAEGVRTEIVESGKKYNLIFEKCVCGMHNAGYINSPHLCECSRQSVMYVMNSIALNKKFDVEICSTILRGGKECKQSITMSDKN